MDFVTHTCKKCECAEKAGIDYDKQKPWNSYSEKQKARLEKLKEAAKKTQFKSKQNNQI